MRKLLTRPIIAGVVGNIMEWYDFMLFAYFAPTLGALFFPSGDSTVELMKVYGLFAVTFIARPAGAVLFGHLGDRIGRRRALELSVLAMAVPTFLLGLLPTYAQAGATATYLLVLMRLLQGFAVGGEFTSSFSFVVEHAPPGERGVHGALTTSGGVAGILLASMVTYFTHLALAEQVQSWGWRVPFLLGIVLSAFAIYVRSGLRETTSFQRLQVESSLASSPIKEVLLGSGRRILHIVFLNCLNAMMFYVLYVYMKEYLHRAAGLSELDASLVNTVSLSLLLFGLPAAAYLSDRWGRRPVLLGGALATAVLAVPAFLLLRTSGFAGAMALQCLLTLCMSAVMGPLPATLTEMFPARTRASGIAISHNLSQTIFGGTAPLVSTWLVQRTGNQATPGVYMVVAALISVVMVLYLRESSRDVLV